MLSTIAEGLAAEGMKKPTAALADQTRQALAMIEKHTCRRTRARKAS